MFRKATRFRVQPGWKLIIADMGLNPAHVLSLAGLPADLFNRGEASLTPQEYFDLWCGLEKAAGSDLVPLKIGAALSAEAFDPPIFASLCSPNLNTALQRLAEYKPLIGPLELEVVIGAETTAVEIAFYGQVGTIPRSLGLTELVFFTQLARMATRSRVVPRQTIVLEMPASRTDYRTFFGCEMTAGEAWRIEFTAADAAQPFLTHDAAMWQTFEPGLKKRLGELDRDAGISQRVKSALLEMLPAGSSSLEDVASRLAMSKRSLQRHLGRSSASFQDILNATRRELAEHYLAHSAVSPGEIAYLLGFHDSNSFLRAFKGWTGTTPGHYRAGRARNR